MAVGTETFSLQREIAIEAKPETVWELLVDEKEAIRWMGMRASFDVQPGGQYRVEVIPGHTASGTFVEIDPPRRLVYTWGWEGGAVPPGTSTVIFELMPRGNGTLLRLTHQGLPTADSAKSHRHGWTHYLDRIAIAANGDPGRDPWIDGPME
jgi:uncharacterized protein YndB with AHSA1/START domain